MVASQSLGFLPQNLGSGRDRMVLCYSMNAGSMVGIDLP